MGCKFYKFTLNRIYIFVKRGRVLPLDPLICIDLSCQGGMPWGGFFYIGIYENLEGTCQSPRHPWAGCLTEILSYVVPFEKFSWCFRSAIFRINDIAVYKNSGILLCLMEKMSCCFFILLVTMSVISRHCSDIYSAATLLLFSWSPALLHKFG